jgi:hypothetical protein
MKLNSLMKNEMNEKENALVVGVDEEDSRVGG